MLRSHQGSAPAHTSLQRVKTEPDTASHVDSTGHLNFWPSSDLSGLSASTFDVDATPKTGSHLLLDNLSTHSCADLLQLGLPSLDPQLATPSAPPSAATTTDGLDTNLFASSDNTSGCQSSPAMSASSNYNLETPSLHQVSALAAPFATSSPTVGSVGSVGSVGTADEISAKTSPSQNEHNWYHASSHDRKPGFDAPADTFRAPYPHKSTAAASAYQTQQPRQAHHNDHDYYAQSAHMPHYFQHRASISGPLIDSYAERYESAVAAHAPPRLHGLAAWENASGSARPHTADGMFGHFNMTSAGAAAHKPSAGMAVNGAASGPSSRLHTPAAHSAHGDDYHSHRRMSMPDPSSASANSKVFSYMASGEDGGAMSSSSGMGMGSQSFGGHYFGGGYGGGASKKRPRRRYDEIERLYPCSWPGCTKSYGTLNHLNAHVAMQKHGPKRSPGEFKDMRKAWRKQKKEEQQQRQSRQVGHNEQALRPSFSSSNYATAPSAELVGGGSAAIAPPPALSGFGGHQHSGSSSSSGNTLPGIGQLPGSLAHLSRYSMSSVSAAPNATQQQQQQQQPLSFNSTSAADTASHSYTTHATPLQYSSNGGAGNSDSSRIPYATHHSNLGAYLAAHRGSI
ncbi:related to putative C2H2 transcriptional regulator [Sporisorium reilianum f. sp. reilianum]|uniref:Related to putative C2H2 transcriptional regulator n=1 Tax=Sporisorium reilianum f. sp. reilianum TaxID=72559 RepID=A0A2N8UDW9_9BASI|nr:related to putative C2H2 transcriptional regulator [Sporisorium reilianum f. sp. reilianum]